MGSPLLIVIVTPLVLWFLTMLITAIDPAGGADLRMTLQIWLALVAIITVGFLGFLWYGRKLPNEQEEKK